jgi:hypothetical protein
MADFIANPRAGQITPLARYTYFDRVHVWLKKPLTPGQLKQIKAHCGDLYLAKRLCKFHLHYRQGLQLFQPTRQARKLLAALASTDEPMITYVEIAQDRVFEDQAEADACVEFFKDHFVQPWHRKSMGMQFYYHFGKIDGEDYFRNFPSSFTTRITPKGGRRMGHWFAGYSDDHCRLSGETPCFHFEGKYCGVRNLKRIGIYDLSDLIDFDFNNYFDTHITLYDLDLERVGRYHRNQQSGSKSRHSHIQRYRKSGFYNHDHRLGATLYNSLALHRDDPYHDERSLLKFLDEYPKARRFLTKRRPENWV